MSPSFMSTLFAKRIKSADQCRVGADGVCERLMGDEPLSRQVLKLML